MDCKDTAGEPRAAAVTSSSQQMIHLALPPAISDRSLPNIRHNTPHFLPILIQSGKRDKFTDLTLLDIYCDVKTESQEMNLRVNGRPGGLVNCRPQQMEGWGITVP